MSSFWETNKKQIHHKMSCEFSFGSSLSFLSVERKKVKGLFPLHLASSKFSCLVQAFNVLAGLNEQSIKLRTRVAK